MVCLSGLIVPFSCDILHLTGKCSAEGCLCPASFMGDKCLLVRTDASFSYCFLVCLGPTLQLATNIVAGINDSAFNLYHINVVQGRLAFNVLIPILPTFTLYSLVSGTSRS